MTLKLNGTNSEAAPAYAGDDADTGLQCGTNELKLVTGGSARATVDSSGRLLLGATSDTTGDAGAKVQIVDTGTPVLALSRNDTSITEGNTIGQIRIFSNDDSGYQECARIAAQADGTFGNDDKPTRLAFSVAADGAGTPTERMRINGAGVGINTTTPFSDAELTVGNNGSGDATIALRRTATGQNDWGITNSGGNLIFKGGDATTVAGLTEYFRFRDTGGLTFNGDTAAANALDDYEEGTWTPSFWAGDDNINVAYGDQSGLYTKIGNIVHINFRLLTSSRTAGTGALYVDGLPFTPTGDRCVLSISPAFSNWGSNNAPYGGFTSTNGRILLKRVDSADARALRDTNIDATNISTAGLIGSMSYKIA